MIRVLIWFPKASNYLGGPGTAPAVVRDSPGHGCPPHREGYTLLYTHVSELGFAEAGRGFLWYGLCPKGLVPAVLGLNSSAGWGTKCIVLRCGGGGEWSRSVKPGTWVSWVEVTSGVITSPGDHPAWWACPSALISAPTTVFCLVTTLQAFCVLKPFSKHGARDPSSSRLFLLDRSCVRCEISEIVSDCFCEGLPRQLGNYDNICRAWMPQTFVVCPCSFSCEEHRGDVRCGAAAAGGGVGRFCRAGFVRARSRTLWPWNHLLREYEGLKKHNK